MLTETLERERQEALESRDFLTYLCLTVRVIHEEKRAWRFSGLGFALGYEKSWDGPIVSLLDTDPFENGTAPFQILRPDLEELLTTSLGPKYDDKRLLQLDGSLMFSGEGYAVAAARVYRVDPEKIADDHGLPGRSLKQRFGFINGRRIGTGTLRSKAAAYGLPPGAMTGRVRTNGELFIFQAQCSSTGEGVVGKTVLAPTADQEEATSIGQYAPSIIRLRGLLHPDETFEPVIVQG